MASSTTLTRGALIVVEGVDRVGKSTLCSKLISYLTSESKPVELLRFPARTTKIGKLIDSYLLGSDNICDQGIHLLFSANRWEMNQTIKDKLLNGITIIVDRYAYSGVAYSAAKMTLSLDWCKNTERGLIRPDSILYLGADPEMIAQRPGFGGEIYEKREFQAKVAAVYEHLKEKDWKTIDASKSPDDVFNVALEEVKQTILSVEGKPISYLWTDD